MNIVSEIKRVLPVWVRLFREHTDGDPEAKLQEEVDEFLEEHSGNAKLGEAADVVIVMLTQLYVDGGYEIWDLLDEVHRKIGVNLTRQWTRNPDGTISHVKRVP